MFQLWLDVAYTIEATKLQYSFQISSTIHRFPFIILSGEKYFTSEAILCKNTTQETARQIGSHTSRFAA